MQGDFGSAADLRAFLSAVAADPVVREAIAVSSASLDEALAKIASGLPMEPKRLRRATLSALRYMARTACRPTPFGLLAGVAPARFDATAKVRFGAEHRRQVRPDMGWLLALLRGWETDDAVVPRLRLVANDLCFVRGDRLVLPYVVAVNDELGPDDRERTVRHTAAVRAVLAAARTPVGHPDLVDLLASQFPQAGRATADAMVRELIRQEFLLTDLRPPSTADDPLAYVLDRLDPEFPGHRLLAGIRAALARYAETPVGTGEGLAAWHDAAAELRRLRIQEPGRPSSPGVSRSRPDNPVQVDLRIDADIVLPDEVAAELERAVTVAWRIAAPQLAPIEPLAGYRAAFQEHYGADALVPVKELLDPVRGLGPPGGYLEPPGERPGPRLETETAERDTVLLELVQRATARGEREIVLSDDAVRRLAHDDDAPGRYMEACAELLSPSEQALREGDFRLVLDTDASQARAGALMGRLLHLVPELAEPLSCLVTELTGTGDGAPVAAQLTHALMQSRNYNLNRVPQLTGVLVQTGVYGDRSRPAVHSLDDVLAGADQHGFYLVSARTGDQIVPMGLSALNPELCLPNAARFLTEVGLAHFGPWMTWHWGRASRLPYLPRVRAGRTVLASARWRPPAGLSGGTLGWEQWRARWLEWSADWGVPSTVRVGQGDMQISLDLTSEAHLRLLHAELTKKAAAVITEEPMGGEYGTGWAGGRAVQVAVPMRPRRPALRTRPARPAGRVRPQEMAARFARAEHRPGGEWLYIKIYAPAARHNEILARHLPELLTAAAPLTDRWFFVRYRDDHAHLRVRFHGEPATLNTHLLPLAHRWANALGASGVIREIVLDTYRPEIVRYGGPAAIEGAERAFCADSASVLEQLALRAAGNLGLPADLLAAANIIDLAACLDPDGWRDWVLDAYPRGPMHQAFQRVRGQALELLDNRDGWSRLRDVPGGAELTESWQRRADAVAGFGRLVRGRDDIARPGAAVFSSLLHMHYNRLAGIDAVGEAGAYAIARGTVQAIRDRERHLGR